MWKEAVVAKSNVRSCHLPEGIYEHNEIVSGLAEI
jgi:hypothetical protein